MSRSYRKPYWTDQQRNKKPSGGSSRSVQAKREANKTVRRANKQACKDGAKEPANGKAYRKESCSWNIRDWSFHDPDNWKARRK